MAASADGEAKGGGGRRRRRRRRRGGGRDTGPVPATLEGARVVAKRRFRIARLHPEQAETIEAVLAGRDAMAVLPTGYGKSLIYQVPAVMMERPTLVISPLIALMRDQEASLRACNVPVVRLDSTLRAAERREALARITEGGTLVVLTTPETLESDAARPAFEAARAGLLCVDEAHCISEWGHDFRPAYLRLGTERDTLDIPQVLALTATATPRVQQDIAKRLGLRDPRIVVAPPHRSNLRLIVHIAPGSEKFERAGRILRRLRRPGIVYSATKQGVDDVYGALLRARIACERYHGGMKTDDRNEQQAKFMKSGRRSVMAATSAFGMGIDKADIRYIMHFHVPASPEQYIQEAGRAGRDGKPSRCILLYDPADLKIQEYLQARARPSPAQLRRVARALAAWAGEERIVSPKELALSAEVAMTTCKSLCAQLEERQLVVRHGTKGYESLVDPKTLEAETKDLAHRFEIERRQDQTRLRAVAEYAESEECRSVFLRRWFGEEDPPACGNCDRCREEDDLGGEERPHRRRRRPTKRSPAGRKKKSRRRKKTATETAGAAPTTKKKRRRRRRRGSRAARPAEA
ncbi:MAG: RecQ family ATP-dependent DNA helicase [Planctomycetota bacterium]